MILTELPTIDIRPSSSAVQQDCHGAGRDIALVKLDLAKLTSRDQPPVYKVLNRLL
jgi:hypothetical protein